MATKTCRFKHTFQGQIVGFGSTASPNNFAAITIKQFRHIATRDGSAEISGHYHPKATLVTRARAISRPAFLKDRQRLIMPAFGTYTGGLRSDDRVLSTLMASDAVAIMTGPYPVQVPMPRRAFS